jgi:hypothetical protein
MVVGGQRHAPAALPAGRDPVHIVQEARVGPRAVLDGCGKCFTPGFDPRTVQPVASRYTDCCIAVCLMCTVCMC